MLCTIRKLFWPRLPNKQCCGPVQKIGDIVNLSESVESLLSKNKCLGDKQSYVEPLSKFDLLTNRLCPYTIKKEALSNIDICQNHLVSVTVKVSD